MTKQLYLLINLGTPKDPTPQAIASFLKQFLSDPLVIDIPSILRWFLVHILIVPQRSKKIAKAYESIWTDRGSPLKFHTEDLAQALQEQVGQRVEVRWAMRYGEPSMESVLKEIDPHWEIKALPLYPQYALSSTQSSIDRLKFVVKKLKLKNNIKFLPYFYQYSEFTSACAEVFRKHAPPHWDHVLFSFHGLPLRHLTKVAQRGSHCPLKAGCCDQIDSSNQFCYRAQSHHSAHQIASQLNLARDKYTISFQSRLGRTKWIQPYTDVWLDTAVQRGIRDLVVICPSFVADCLETLEEINLRESKKFKEKGGQSLTLIPCVNSETSWIHGIKNLLTEHNKDWMNLDKI